MPPVSFCSVNNEALMSTNPSFSVAESIASPIVGVSLSVLPQLSGIISGITENEETGADQCQPSGKTLVIFRGWGSRFCILCSVCSFCRLESISLPEVEREVKDVSKCSEERSGDSQAWDCPKRLELSRGQMCSGRSVGGNARCCADWPTSTFRDRGTCYETHSVRFVSLFWFAYACVSVCYFVFAFVCFFLLDCHWGSASLVFVL